MKMIRISLLIFLLLAIILFYTYKYVNSDKLEIPITYKVGWWPDQNSLQIENFETKIIESELNIFNKTSIISYEIKGYIKPLGIDRPYIKEVHLSERIVSDSSSNKDRIIEITPIVMTKQLDAESDEIQKFNFKNEIKITSNSWGKNKIKFKCKDKEKIIILNQEK